MKDFRPRQKNGQIFERIEGQFMFPYANNNIELFNQLADEGYSTEDLELIVQTYEWSMRLFSGRVFGYGRDYFSHLVRTASILGFLHAPSSVVAAGLIHNAYQNADFGLGQRGISPAKRRLIQKTLGQEVEESIAGFHLMKWNEHTFPIIREKIESSDRVFRNVVLIKLADHLEHNLDYGVLYFKKIRRDQLLKQNLPAVPEMAEKLGYPSLAKDLNWVFLENARAEIPMEASWHKEQLFSPYKIPLSCRKRFSIVAYETLANVKDRLRQRFIMKTYSKPLLRL